MKRNRTVGAGFLVLAVLILNALVRLIPSGAFDGRINPYIALILLQILTFAVPSVVYLLLRRGPAPGRLRLRLPKSRHIVFTVSALLASVSGSTLINYGMSRLIGSDYSASSVSYSSALTGGVSGGVYAIFALALVPAVFEEFLFRGIVAAEYECCGVKTAVFFSALLFTVSHFSFMRAPVYFFSGLLLVFVMYVTRSVFASMLVHAASNICALFFEDFVYRVVNRQGIVIFLFAVSVVFLLSLIITFGEAEKIYSYYGVLNIESPPVLSGKERVSFVEALINPAFAAIILFYIIMGAIS